MKTNREIIRDSVGKGYDPSENYEFHSGGLSYRRETLPLFPETIDAMSDSEVFERLCDLFGVD